MFHVQISRNAEGRIHLCATSNHPWSGTCQRSSFDVLWCFVYIYIICMYIYIYMYIYLLIEFVYPLAQPDFSQGIGPSTYMFPCQRCPAARKWFSSPIVWRKHTPIGYLSHKKSEDKWFSNEDTLCMEYLPTFGPFFGVNVGKHSLCGAWVIIYAYKSHWVTMLWHDRLDPKIDGPMKFHISVHQEVVSGWWPCHLRYRESKLATTSVRVQKTNPPWSKPIPPKKRENI